MKKTKINTHSENMRELTHAGVNWCVS